MVYFQCMYDANRGSTQHTDVEELHVDRCSAKIKLQRNNYRSDIAITLSVLLWRTIIFVLF